MHPWGLKDPGVSPRDRWWAGGGVRCQFFGPERSACTTHRWD